MTNLKTIDTLVEDIYDLFRGKKEVSAENVAVFSAKLAEKIAGKISRERSKTNLRMSNAGTPDRKLWYEVNKPELAEALDPAAQIKYLFGDILEELLLFLAKEAGHTVTDEQREVEINGVKGHIDCFVDGVLLDCKSSSPAGMAKFRDHRLEHDDVFGYLTQLRLYGSAVGADLGAFLAIDKSQGHIVLDKYRILNKDWEAEIERKREMLKGEMPERCFSDVSEGASGARKLGLNCSYCAFKKHCWPGLKIAFYSNKPVFFTKTSPKMRVKVEDV